MTNEEKRKIYAALAAPFPEHCIQRTEGRVTGRGYDTSGIGYQFIANRLNEVLGVGGWRAHRTVIVKEILRTNGRPAFEAICDIILELGEWLNGDFAIFAESLADGGHVASSEADARKGAYTNAFKKAAAFFGVGRQAYEGSLDDDNVPSGQEEHRPDNATHPTPAPQRPVPVPAQAASQQPPARPAAAPRNRLTSKQLSALWAISRKLGLDQVEFRNQVKAQHGVQVEFLSKQQASDLIGAMGTNGNADRPYVAPEFREPGQEG